MALRFRLGPLWRVYWPKKFRDSMKLLNEFVEPFVKKAINQGVDEKMEDGKGENFTVSLSSSTKR
jgi:hypothetical protein